MSRRILAILSVAVLLAVLSGSLPGSAQPRPVELTRLSEKEQWTAVQRAAPGDVFLVRGRRVAARELQAGLPRARAAAEVLRRRLKGTAQPWKSDQLETLRRLADLERRIDAREQRTFMARTLEELRASAGPDSPEIRNLRTEMVRLAGQWIQAPPEERRALEGKLRALEEQLRRLGASLR